ncbi:organoarsenical effux MFS transporter ArsJ [Nodularia spumigena CS-584]|jgi:MFS family permease|uniref:Organoarsenical effux MFS transporter ArsJ n=1 Tax=Nodularia spumigena UHCC 0060 TaxID=3110300 RepID=A0ABU5UUL2_NODSP|nr:organoarsenical effux MFS transporter ArsJ [Nodularia spumigena]AHJ29676.1 Permease of the major facilitator superfamily [Nodularia spumigena CCY9414]EAW43826.1 Major facilitator superfamily protein [Nodularia spumigena CCY9414]MDB9383014.1 organoarsenical effux MFS transporter ArsJ [Nodularia spumigena CS-584]MEA5527430.1 organoarsenical effux MFS transporter ArsJ [Nodularia spumigena UHCC 0143]MEA5557215.1 organoarsenical effux MFS transporter ArsJ [Nodularia spumigena CH309]
MTSTASRANVKNYVLVTLAYWGFTITDGALRMLVLLYFDSIGYTPLQIASLFLFYEIFGVVTNFLGGWIGSQLGLKITLYAGIGLQVFSMVMLSWLNPDWVEWLAVGYVMVAQAFSGVAKDLTKMSSKSAIRLVVPQEDQSSLFKWVAVLTGSKNALKGIGFFVGSVLLASVGFTNSLLIMAGGLFLIMFTGLMLPKGLGKIKAKVKFKQLFSKSKEINILSAARFFLFGSRDVWFVVGLPVFLRGTLGWSFYQVGGFLACWVIGYGVIQFLAPVLIQKFGSGQPPQSKTIQFWTFTLTAVPGAIALALQLGVPGNIAIIGGLLVFGVVFAFNSAVHSYLVLAFTDDDKVALNVGFYYMANSGGRLAGTVLSGLVFQYFDLVGCLWTSMFLVLAAGLVTIKLPDPKPSKAILWKAEGGE